LEEVMEARNAGQKSLIRSIESALSIDASNTQISVNAQLISGIIELLIKKEILSKEEVLSLIEEKKEMLVSRYTNNKEKFEMIDSLDLYYLMSVETEQAFDKFKGEIENL
jgi:hypothetical protein